MEAVDCLLCGCADRQVRFRGRDRLHGVPGEFSLVECARCRFVYLSPRPSPAELPSFYPPTYLPFRPALHEEASPFRRFERLIGLRNRCRVVLRYRAHGSLLDVGCGTGDFLAVMRSDYRWSVCGLEPHPLAASQARAKYELEVVESYLDDARFPPESFDAITLWDVLEHVPDPGRALAIIHRLLRPEGIVVLGVPDRGSFDARIFGAYWAGLDVPRHFSVFSAADLTRALAESEFCPPEIFNLNGGYHSFALSVQFWLRGTAKPEWFTAATERVVGSIPFRAFASPYFAAVRRLRRGSTMIAVARKPIGTARRDATRAG